MLVRGVREHAHADVGPSRTPRTQQTTDAIAVFHRDHVAVAAARMTRRLRGCLPDATVTLSARPESCAFRGLRRSFLPVAWGSCTDRSAHTARSARRRRWSTGASDGGREGNESSPTHSCLAYPFRGHTAPGSGTSRIGHPWSPKMCWCARVRRRATARATVGRSRQRTPWRPCARRPERSPITWRRLWTGGQTERCSARPGPGARTRGRRPAWTAHTSGRYEPMLHVLRSASRTEAPRPP